MKNYRMPPLIAPRFAGRNVSTGPPDCGLRRTRAWRFRRVLCGLAASFMIASPFPAASQSEQLGAKLVGIGAVGPAEQGWSVALSADGRTAIVGGIVDNKLTGAVWVFTRDGDVWTQQGDKLVGTNGVGQGGQGSSVALSADGNTAIVGGPYDNSNTGAVWVYNRNGTVWTHHLPFPRGGASAATMLLGGCDRLLRLSRA